MERLRTPKQFLPPVLLLTVSLLFPALSTAAESAGGSTIELVSPARIARAGAVLYVTDYRQSAVIMVNTTGLKPLRSFPIAGSPLAVAWHRGQVYVGNETTGHIEVYNPAGKHVADLGGTVTRPNDMAFDDRSGALFVVDGGDSSLKVFDRDGALTQTITSQDLVNPTGIVLDADRGEIYVSDYGDPALKYPARVLVFDYAGNLLRTLPGRTGGFSRPQGMALDGGHVFLADGLIGKVLVLDSSTGTVLKSLGSFGTDPGQLMLPLDVTVDPLTKDVYVTNNRLGRIERFPGGGIVP
jgi:DNA-binding beta-propeller fold protein YncE